MHIFKGYLGHEVVALNELPWKLTSLIGGIRKKIVQESVRRPRLSPNYTFLRMALISHRNLPIRPFLVQKSCLKNGERFKIVCLENAFPLTTRRYVHEKAIFDELTHLKRMQIQYG